MGKRTVSAAQKAKQSAAMKAHWKKVHAGERVHVCTGPVGKTWTKKKIDPTVLEGQMQLEPMRMDRSETKQLMVALSHKLGFKVTQDQAIQFAVHAALRTVRGES